MSTIFISPGVFTREQDFSVFASRVGITRLGLVGKTQKGPAFEPIKVRSTDEFLLRFGGTSTKLPLAYVANSFLSQSNELTVTRVLGRGGFTNSPAWMIVADMQILYTGTTTQSGVTFSIGGLASPTIYNFSSQTNGLMTPGTVSANTVGNNTTIQFSGVVSTQSMVSALTGASSFVSLGISTTNGSPTSYIGVDTFSLSANTVQDLGSKSGATLAVLRSKRNQITDSFYFFNESDITLGSISTVLGSFVISASTGPLTAVTNSGYTVSLDETKEDYIGKIISRSPEIINGEDNFYIEKIYPHFIREAYARGDIKGLHAVPIYGSGVDFTDYGGDFSHSSTPWIVSRTIGGNVRDLFRVHTTSDGDTSSREVKISIRNININTNTFDLVVRRFEDTDATSSQTTLETFSNLSLKESDSNFISKVIGNYDETYPRRSMFISIEMADSFPVNTVPAGFRGYSLRSASISGETSPDIYYKASYLSGDTVFKTYLGISELGYGNFSQSQVSVKNSIKSIEADIFSYEGAISSGMTVIKGFHLENTADSDYFISGDKNSITAYTNTAGTAIDKQKLKFTVVPAGGFDGFDKYRTYDEAYEEFQDNLTSNVSVYKEALATFANPEEVDVNIFATPGIDFSNNETLIKYALDIFESRADTLYFMDAPRITIGAEKGTPEQVVSALEATGIDSNYAATYWPWIQIKDPSSGKFTYQSPTLMVVRAAAYTDNVAYPWFVIGGVTRGSAGNSVQRTDIKLNKFQRDTLYGGRVNPIADFVQQGVVIFGQKTLQTSESALDRINVRRLLLQVRRLISAAALTLLFEQNDQTLRDQFLSKVEPILLQIQNQRGLTAFKVVMDDSNNTEETIDRNTLTGKIQIKPTRAAEFIDLTFQVLPSGASFEDF